MIAPSWRLPAGTLCHRGNGRRFGARVHKSKFFLDHGATPHCGHERRRSGRARSDRVVQEAEWREEAAPLARTRDDLIVGR